MLEDLQEDGVSEGEDGVSCQILEIKRHEDRKRNTPTDHDNRQNSDDGFKS